MKICTALLGVAITPALFAQASAAKPAQNTTTPPAVKTAPAPPALVQVPPIKAPAAAVDPNQVILTVGDEKITAAQYDEMLGGIPQQYQDFARGAGKRQFVENVIQLKLLSKEAEKRNLDKQAKVQEQLAFQKQNLLAAAMFQELQNSVKVDDAAVQQYFDQHKNEYEQVKARHILIRVKGAPMPAENGKKELTDEEALAKAQEIRKRLLAGEDFAKVAQVESDDRQSGQQGGDLGTFKHGMMVPPFEQAAFALPVGQLSEPVKTPFGYHIIKVDSKEAKTLAEARPEIEKKLRPEMARKEVEALRKAANVKIDDAYFGPTPAPAGPAGPAQ